MNNSGLDLHCSMLLEEYWEKLPIFEQLRQVVMKKLSEIISESGIELNSMESRVKSEASLIGKLELKGHKYATLYDITDIFGARLITFYNEDVDRIASIAETIFDIDWPNSVDKRKTHQFSSFGYNSLHYICRIPQTLYHDPQYPELNEIRFELQMRTALQHVWSFIQHDIGYKTDIETPIEYHRSLSRLSGLLELADIEFSRISNEITNYRRRMQSLVDSGKLEEIPLNGDTFRSYLSKQPFQKLNRRIAAITKAELHPTTAMPYLGALFMLDMKTLADVERLIREESEDAYQLALYQLGSTDIDILADTVGLQSVCVVRILKRGGGQAGLKQLFETIYGPSSQSDVLADIVMKQASRLSFMNEKN